MDPLGLEGDNIAEAANCNGGVANGGPATVDQDVITLDSDDDDNDGGVGFVGSGDRNNVGALAPPPLPQIPAARRRKLRPITSASGGDAPRGTTRRTASTARKSPTAAKGTQDHDVVAKKPGVFPPFALFTQDHRERLMAYNPRMTYSEAGRRLGLMWQNLPMAEKERYRDRAKKMTTRKLRDWNQQMAKRNGRYAQTTNPDPPEAAAALDPGDVAARAMHRRRTLGYALFCDEVRKGMPASIPAQEVSRLMAKKWFDLSPFTRQAYEDRAALVNENKRQHHQQVQGGLRLQPQDAAMFVPHHQHQQHHQLQPKRRQNQRGRGGGGGGGSSGLRIKSVSSLSRAGASFGSNRTLRDGVEVATNGGFGGGRGEDQDDVRIDQDDNSSMVNVASVKLPKSITISRVDPEIIVVKETKSRAAASAAVVPANRLQEEVQRRLPAGTTMLATSSSSSSSSPAAAAAQPRALQSLSPKSTMPRLRMAPGARQPLHQGAPPEPQPQPPPQPIRRRSRQLVGDTSNAFLHQQPVLAPQFGVARGPGVHRRRQALGDAYILPGQQPFLPLPDPDQFLMGGPMSAALAKRPRLMALNMHEMMNSGPQRGKTTQLPPAVPLSGAAPMRRRAAAATAAAATATATASGTLRAESLQLPRGMPKKLCRTCYQPSSFYVKLAECRKDVLEAIRLMVDGDFDLVREKGRGLPAVLCRKCWTLLGRFKRFKKLVDEGQSRLRQMLERRQQQQSNAEAIEEPHLAAAGGDLGAGQVEVEATSTSSSTLAGAVEESMVGEQGIVVDQQQTVDMPRPVDLKAEKIAVKVEETATVINMVLVHDRGGGDDVDSGDEERDAIFVKQEFDFDKLEVFGEPAEAVPAEAAAVAAPGSTEEVLLSDVGFEVDHPDNADVFADCGVETGVEEGLGDPEDGEGNAVEDNSGFLPDAPAFDPASDPEDSARLHHRRHSEGGFENGPGALEESNADKGVLNDEDNDGDGIELATQIDNGDEESGSKTPAVQGHPGDDAGDGDDDVGAAAGPLQGPEQSRELSVEVQHPEDGVQC